MSTLTEILKQHSQWKAVLAIQQTLEQKGYRAYLAGGCVRDALLGVPANDLDIATDALPEEIEKLFPKTIPVGKSFGVIRVLMDGHDIELATFRNDGEYKDGRRPEGISFSSPEEDALRRDFTINAMFYDLGGEQVLDYVHGLDDIAAKLIRAVGDPQRRFEEDHLRILRGVRFVAQLGFSLEKQTQHCISQMATLVRKVSGERIHDELGKLLRGADLEKGLTAFVDLGLAQALFASYFVNCDPVLLKTRAASDVERMAIFFARFSEAGLKYSFELLKFSNADQKFIANFYAVINNELQFYKQRVGAQLQRYFEPGVAFALSLNVNSGPNFAASKDLLQLNLQKHSGRLPEPFLRGGDIPSRITGKKIGLVLAEAYLLQLEFEIIDKPAAVEWLNKWLSENQTSTR